MALKLKRHLMPVNRMTWRFFGHLKKSITLTKYLAEVAKFRLSFWMVRQS
jgi:hypothetical protein